MNTRLRAAAAFLLYNLESKLDPVNASAILDWLSMNGRFIICEGRSYRSRK